MRVYLNDYKDSYKKKEYMYPGEVVRSVKSEVFLARGKTSRQASLRCSAKRINAKGQRDAPSGLQAVEIVCRCRVWFRSSAP